MVQCVANLCLLSAVALALTACSSSKKEPDENPNLFPADYKNEILTTMTSTLENPTNVRAAYISDPVLRPVPQVQRSLEARAGIEPAVEVLQTSALPLGDRALLPTVSLLGLPTKDIRHTRTMKTPRLARGLRESMERETGFEPATSTLARSHSTTELLPRGELIITD